MIIGMGSDLCDVRRIEKSIARFGDRFLDRIFTKRERERSERRKRSVESYAKRFAAKEACAKALGTGFRAGVFFRDLEAQIELTITDEGPLAQAIVVISAVPKAGR